MPDIVLRWFVTTLAILIVPALVSGVRVESFMSALAMAAVLGVINAIVRPVLIVLTFPLTVLSLGFFLLVINAVTFMMAGGIVSGMKVDSFGAAFFAALIVTLVSWIVNLSIKKSESGRSRVVIRTKTKSSGGEPVFELHSKDGKKWE